MRSNDEGQIGFLKDLRRMNVAMTRARMKLIILGSKDTMTKHPFYKKLWEYVEAINLSKEPYEKRMKAQAKELEKWTKKQEASTIKEISENWLGKATISMQTDSRSRGQSESYSQNTQRLGRELMTPAELATMPGDKCILQLRGLPPFFSPKYDLKRHPNYRYTAEADKQKNAFDLDRLINRRRRPRLNEACTMYEVTVPDDALTEEDEDILNYDDIDDPDAFA